MSKLYMKARSEKAEKGQGGNQFIDIDLLVGDAQNQVNAGRVTMRVCGDTFWIDYFYHEAPGKSVKKVELFYYEKGEKQKGEKAKA